MFTLKQRTAQNRSAQTQCECTQKEKKLKKKTLFASIQNDSWRSFAADCIYYNYYWTVSSKISGKTSPPPKNKNKYVSHSPHFPIHHTQLAASSIFLSPPPGGASQRSINEPTTRSLVQFSFEGQGRLLVTCNITWSQHRVAVALLLMSCTRLSVHGFVDISVFT